MTTADAIFIGASIVWSLGGGAVVVFALSNWLGKIWADRLMQKERQEYASQLENLRNALRRASEEQLAALRAQLDIAKEARGREHLDRVTIYRAVVGLSGRVCPHPPRERVEEVALFRSAFTGKMISF